MTKTMAKDKPTGIIYFVQQGTEGPIKVGYTEQSIQVRLAGLQVGNPCELYVIKIIDGTRVDEANIQNLFRDCRIRGEWFTPTNDLNSFMVSLKDGVDIKAARRKAEIISFDVLVKERQKLDDIRERAIKRANGR